MLRIGGMHCAACSSRVQRALAALPGTSDARVNLLTGMADVSLNTDAAPETVLRDAQNAMTALGFTAEEASSDEDDRETWARDEAEADARLKALRARLWPMFACALPLLALSMGHMAGMPLPLWLDPAHAPRAFALTQLVLAAPTLWWGRSFYISGFSALARRVPNMNSLAAIGTGAAFAYSLWQTADVLGNMPPRIWPMDLYYESGAALLTMITLGNYLEALSRRRAADALGALARLAPETALRLEYDNPVEVPVQELRVGDMVLIRAGSRIPADGVVVEGFSGVDMSLLTGESMPVTVRPGDALTGGGVNGEGVLTMRVSRVGRDSALARIIRLVREAQGSRAPIARLADQASYYFVPTVMLLATFSALLWSTVGGESPEFALRVFVAVLIIACPCAMGLATPTALMVAAGRGAQLGVLIKNAAALEQAARITVLALDKTGTLTTGEPRLADVIPLGDMSADVLLKVALALETRSEHPLAHALLEAGKERGIIPPPVRDPQVTPGLGLRGVVDLPRGPVQAALGSRAFMERIGALRGQEDTTARLLDALADAGATPLLLAVDGRLEGILALADRLRPESARVVAQLRAMGLRVAMLSGDNPRTARAVARQAGVEEVLAGMLPQEKEAAIARLQAEGHVVGMVGDGVNDAPALVRAHVGMAMGKGADVSVEASDIVLMRGGMEAVLTALALSRAAMRNIRQNLFWAFGYNLLGVPVAAGLLHVFGGPTLSPMLAGAAMALSSVSVVCNALRLRRFGKRNGRASRPEPIPGSEIISADQP